MHAMFTFLLYRLDNILGSLLYSLFYTPPDFSATTIGPLFNIKRGRKRGCASYTTDLAPCLEEIRMADHIYVTRMEWRKSRVKPFHEFIVFHIVDSSNGYTDVLMIKGGTYNEEAEQHQADVASSADLTSCNTCTLDRNDRVIFSTSGTAAFISKLMPRNQILAKLTEMEHHQISVPMIANLAYVLRHNTEHNILAYRSYWFAGHAYEILKSKCLGSKEIPGSKYDIRGTVGGTNVGVKLNPPSIELVAKFDAVWAEYQADTFKILLDREDRRWEVSIHCFA